jgi:hypothetical protein
MKRSGSEGTGGSCAASVLRGSKTGPRGLSWGELCDRVGNTDLKGASYASNPVRAMSRPNESMRTGSSKSWARRPSPAHMRR